jgi:LysM repeat protein
VCLLALLITLAGLPAAAIAQTAEGQSMQGPASHHSGRPTDVAVYTVRRGDTLSGIAYRYHTTVRVLMALNPQIRNPNRLWVGQRILVPAPVAQPTPTPQPPADFTRSQIFLIALDDGGQSGRLIGCNDSLVPVTIEIAPTRAILRASLEKLLSLHDPYYGQSGLYNALYQSTLTLEDVRIDNRVATIKLSGQIVQGGVCDTPRIQAQLEQVALQFSTVSRVEITVNGRPLSEVLSLQ